MKRRAKNLIPLLALAAACSSDEPIMNGVEPPPVSTAGTAALPPASPTAMSPTLPPSTGTAGTGSSTGQPSGPPVMMPTMPPNQGGVAGGAANPPTGMMMPPDGNSMPMDCRGFSFENIKYSPGGNVLPNKCEPYNATTNNPYAVRCTDVWPWYKTSFPGDNFCILPPPPDKGVGYGVHPQGLKWFEQVSAGDMKGYDVTADVWLMDDGEEENANYLTSASNTTMQNYYRNYPRMRPGSHHMIVSVGNTGTPETWGPDLGTGLGAEFSLPGAQRPDENAPKSLEKPEEDKGLYARLPPNPGISFNMHHFNASGKKILKETWTNLWWESDATIQVHGILGLEFTQVATLAVPPGGVVDLHYSWNITQPIRLVTAFGHRHAWTTNFVAWVEEGGKNDIIYQSYQWLDEPTYRYDSQTMNPVPNPAARTDGAASGIRTLMPGQKLHFNCHIEFTDARAQTEKAPMPSEVGTLRFANEAFTAEMCILFGSTAATRLPTPAVDVSPLPDFAKK